MSGSTPPCSAAANLGDVAQDLLQLASDLPSVLRDEVQSATLADVASTAAELMQQCNGRRLLLLQSASLHRATQLTPLMKERLVAMAQAVQQRRAELVKVLQRLYYHQQKRRQSSAAALSKGDGESPYTATWRLISQAMAVEKSLTCLVDAALCPSTDAFHAFLEEAVVHRQLHRQMIEESAQPAVAEVPPKKKAAKSTGESLESHRAAQAVEEGLVVLQRQMEQRDAAKGAEGRRKVNTAAAATQKKAGEESCLNEEVSVDSDAPECSEAHLASAADVVYRLRLPAIVSLEQYAADFPWVAEAAVDYDEAVRERRRRGGADALRRGKAEGETMHKHVSDSNSSSGSGGVPPLLGPNFYNSAASNAGSPSHPERHAGLSGSHWMPPDASQHERPVHGGHAAEEAVNEDAAAARIIVLEVVKKVDMLWRELESTPVSIMRQLHATKRELRKGLHPSSTTAGTRVADGASDSDDGGNDDDEVALIDRFVEAVQARYSVELVAHVLASRQAVELLLESEDSVVFDERRALFLGVGSSGGAGAGSAPAPRSDGGALVSSLNWVSFCTLSLPGIEQVFYVIALCMGASLFSEVAAQQRGGQGSNEKPHDIIDVDGDDDDDDDGNADTLLSARHRVNEEDEQAGQRLAQLTRSLALQQLIFSTFPSPPSAPAAWGGGEVTMASMYRLWKYLFEFVFTTEDTIATSARSGGSGTSATASASPSLRLSSRTSRKWIEKIISASMQRSMARMTLVQSGAPGATEGMLQQLRDTKIRGDGAEGLIQEIWRDTSARLREELLRHAGPPAPCRPQW